MAGPVGRIDPGRPRQSLRHGERGRRYCGGRRRLQDLARGKYRVLHKFNGNDGSQPSGELLPDGQGNFYGVTSRGTTQNRGEVYKMAPDGSVTAVYVFSGDADGYVASGALIADEAGNLYGTTQYGGSMAIGIVYKVALNGTETILHDFKGFRDRDGGKPGGLMFQIGALYGTTGSFRAREGGKFFRIDADGTFEILVSLRDRDRRGCLPNSSLVMGMDGALYGTDESGGKSDTYGAIFN
jgi:uncharacterized repeat protein (TIGR03803 family)